MIIETNVSVPKESGRGRHYVWQAARYQCDARPVVWGFCPECGSDEANEYPDMLRVCNDCGQDWYTDVDYTDVIRANARPQPAQQVSVPEETVENWRHDSEEMEALHANFDDAGLPRAAQGGEVYSAWGRALRFAEQQGSVPEDKAINLCHWLYRTGFVNGEKGQGYDPENREAFRYCLDAMTATTPKPEGDGWVKCSERLPTEEDDYVWLYFRDHGVSEDLWRWDDDIGIHGETHWMPTGLKRPQPPQEREGNE